MKLPETALEVAAARLKSAPWPADGDRLARRLAERADADGLLDVAYASIPSPIGDLLAAATGKGLVWLSFPGHPVEAALDELSREVSPRLMELPSRIEPYRRELDEYFAGSRRKFDLPVDWRLIHGFHVDVLRVTAAIPYGSVSTYAEVAARAGSPRASRAAGNALGSNPIPIVIPCHRVLRTGGALGGYGGGLEVKRMLLRLEGARPA
jgi:methylated-DNA-[protein]-cysteine S-methyltransferase